MTIADAISDAMHKLMTEIRDYQYIFEDVIGDSYEHTYPKAELIKMFSTMRYLIMRSDMMNIDKANTLKTRERAYEDAKETFEKTMAEPSDYDDNGKNSRANTRAYVQSKSPELKPVLKPKSSKPRTGLTKKKKTLAKR